MDYAIWARQSPHAWRRVAVYATEAAARLDAVWLNRPPDEGTPISVVILPVRESPWTMDAWRGKG